MTACARRETLEETGLMVEPTSALMSVLAAWNAQRRR